MAYNKNAKDWKKYYKNIMFGGLVLAALLVIIFMNREEKKVEDEGIRLVKDSDLIIPIKDITEKANFYPAEMDGTTLEVIAVKASDGTIRTAFNTCQVCYNSGRGYYKQQNNTLVCQNCGNQFKMDEVEVTRGGCNPIPITDEYKTVDDDNIVLSKDFLTQVSVIFKDWK